MFGGGNDGVRGREAALEIVSPSCFTSSRARTPNQKTTPCSAPLLPLFDPSIVVNLGKVIGLFCITQIQIYFKVLE